MNILLTAKQAGSVNALAPVARELKQRGHDLTIYATGNPQEASGFGGLDYSLVDPVENTYSELIREQDALVVGLSGYETHDGYFVRAANALGIPSVALQTQNSDHKGKLGTNLAHLPMYIAVMDEQCITTSQAELGSDIGEEVARRSRVVGWTAFDHFAKRREDFTETDRVAVLKSIGVNSENPVYVHFTQTTHPTSAYMKRVDRPYEQKVKDFLYEQGVVQFTFEAASDLGLKLVIKPHPGEEPQPGENLRSYTRELCDRHGFKYIPAKACDTVQLMLAASSVTAGRSTCLTQGTLLDRNCGGIIPDMGEEWTNAFPPLALGAIPFTQTWGGIKDVLQQVTSQDQTVLEKLALGRKIFSVDGKAASRLADLVEELAR